MQTQRSLFALALSALIVAGSLSAAQAVPAEPDQIAQLSERDTRTSATMVTDRAPRTICHAGAKWLRLRFTELALKGSDSVTLTGSAGGTFTLTAQHWPGKAFHTRAFPGECIRLEPRLADSRSGYAVDRYQSGKEDLAQATVTVAAVGDVCGNFCNQTAALISAMSPTALVLPGDLAYENGSLSDFNSMYHPHYGPFMDISYPAPGNHEYQTSGASGYFDYFNGVGNNTGRAGERGKGYYSFDVGDWHFVALNSNIARGAGSLQEQWLRNDLTANTKPCTAAFWHHPLFSRGTHGDDTSVRPLYQALYDHRADLLLVGHDHNYQRFAMARPDGVTDTVNGVRELLIGTGGRSHYEFDSTSAATLEAGNTDTYGVGKLTLTASTYRADFVPVAGSSYTDTVTGTCKKAATQPDFGVSVNPGALSVAQGNSGTGTVSVSSQGGFSSAVGLSASGLPSGVTASFAPGSVTAPGTSTLTLSASATAALGMSTVTITGTSGSVTRSTTMQLTVQSGGGGDVFADDFETDKGWTVNAGGTDTATAGLFERGDPEATDSSGVKQLSTTTSGVNALVTGRLAGSSAGVHDVDGGVTSIRSPAITLPSGGSSLSFQYNVAHGSNSGSNDYFRVQIVDGTAVTTVFEKLGAASDVDGSWKPSTVDLSAFAGRTIRVQVVAADVGTASLFEAQVDDVRVTPSSSTVVYADDFETDKGWTVNPSGTDTATLGMFERGDPEETVSASQIKQLGGTTSGVSCLVTGRLAGSSAGAHDVDGGVTSIRSPAILLPSAATTLTFRYSVAHGSNSSASDYLRVRIVDGTTVTTLFERLGAATELAGTWQSASVSLATYSGRSVRILVEAGDTGTASLFEAQLDDLRIA